MLLKGLLFLLLCLGFIPGFGQASYLQARLDGVWNMPRVKVLQNTGGYQIRSGRPLGGFKIGYSHFNQRNLGVSVGLQLARKQYVIYEKRGQRTALLWSATTPHYYTLSLPLAFEYRGNPFLDQANTYYRQRFFSLSAGVALAYTKETAITVRSRGKGSNFQSSLSHTDNFAFASVWGYEIFLNPAYNFRFRNGSYMGMGVGFTLSPARYASLSINQERDGGQYVGSFQPHLLNYLSLSISYHFPVLTGSRDSSD